MEDKRYSAGAVTASGGNIGNHGSHGSPWFTSSPKPRLENHRQIVERTGHSVYNLQPVAWLAERAHKPGLLETIPLPGGELSTLVLVKSLPRSDGTYWLIWSEEIPLRLRKRGVVPRQFVTSTALRAATPYVEWEERMNRTRSLL